MGATFGELDGYLDPGLALTVRGKVYTVPLPSAALGLWCRRISATAQEVTAASTDEELLAAGKRASERAATLPPLPGGGKLSFEEHMLGPELYAEMIADEVPDPYVLFCAQTTYVWIVSGEEAAQRYWEAGGRPEARGPANRAERRAAIRTSSTGEAGETPTPGSSSGTRSRRRSGGSGRRRGTGGGKS